jgi:adenylate cyclase
LHWGEVFLGVIGDQDRLEFSVFGDAVNTAARLESLTRDLQMDLIVSNDLVTAAGGPGRLDGLVSIPPIEVKGRRGALELLGVPIRSENAEVDSEAM